jgi:hypothetical protein
VYGGTWRLRRAIAQAGRGCVLAVLGTVQSGWARCSVAEIAEARPPEAWVRASCRAGAKGPRVYDRAYVAEDALDDDGFEQGVLVRRHAQRRAERAQYLRRAPRGTTLETLIAVPGTRWTIESGFEQTKARSGSISTRCAAMTAGTGT